jgi:4-methoxybenzoate monooxygenase (O-demethylating)
MSDAPVLDLDPFSDAFLADPFPHHAALREAGPVVRLPAIGAHAVARHAEVVAVLNDWRSFCSSRGVGVSDFAREKPWRPPSLVLETDPPEHDRARRVLSRVMSQAAMRRLREGFEHAAERLVDRLLDGREFDAVPEVAVAYPMSVFPDAVGLTQEGREHLLPYAAMAFNAFGPDNELRRRALAEGAPHIAYVTAQCARDRLTPGGFGAAVHEAADSGEVTPEEATLLVRSLLTAGIDTTVNGLAAALLHLARNPGEWARLRADPSLAKGAFEEAVRIESPVQTFFRTTTRDVTLSGISLPEGQKVLMFLGAANRDPRRFEDPDRYDITRRTIGHVGFGFGVHLCAGLLVARLEGEALLAALARRVGGLELTGAPRWQPNNTLRSLASLPMRLSAA